MNKYCGYNLYFLLFAILLAIFYFEELSKNNFILAWGFIASVLGFALCSYFHKFIKEFKKSKSKKAKILDAAFISAIVLFVYVPAFFLYFKALFKYF